ncbi:MAG: hypothetical protein ILA34_03020 [Bacteroidaceae bacterium]|nr:hypothetical protein [Bacteroidaceae bacterium]
MKTSKTWGIILASLLTTILPCTGQDNITTTVSADVVSQYIWRGQQLGEAGLQPTLALEYKGLSLSAWGNLGIVNSNDTKEFDLTAAYSLGGLNIGLTDYWFNDPNEKYFQYKAHSTSHVFEANVGYDFGPVSLQWYTNLGGNDGCNKKGKRAYSSYAELDAPFRLGGCEWTATVGCVPYATDFYATAHGFAVTHVGVSASKELKITDSFTLPVFAGITANPSTQKAYFVFGLTLHP